VFALTNPNMADSNLHGSYTYSDTLKGIYYGPACVHTALPRLLSVLGGSKAFVITGKSLREKTNVVTNVEQILKDNGAFAATFSEIGQHAPVQGIIRGIEAFRAAGADIIVSIGGGSPIDASKAIVYRLQQQSGGKFLNHIAIPTTLSAAEYRGGAGYTDEQGNKVSVSDPMIAPAGVILDAELTLATPEELWLSTGIRALDHAVEGLYHPAMPYPLQVFCYAALSDLFKYLPKSKAQPGDLEARQKLLIAAWMSLWPKTEKYGSLGLSHSLGHKLGATYGIPHGITSCLTLASVVGLKADVASPEDKAALAGALFYLREPTTGSVEGDVKRLGSKIDALVRGLGLHRTLAAYNVPKANLPTIAKLALAGDNSELQPRVEALLDSIYDA